MLLRQEKQMNGNGLHEKGRMGKSLLSSERYVSRISYLMVTIKKEAVNFLRNAKGTFKINWGHEIKYKNNVELYMTEK